MTEYTDQYLDQIPREWTHSREIPVSLSSLEILRHAGKVEMKIIRPRGPNNRVYGRRQYFRRVAA